MFAKGIIKLIMYRDQLILIFSATFSLLKVEVDINMFCVSMKHYVKGEKGGSKISHRNHEGKQRGKCNYDIRDKTQMCASEDRKKSNGLSVIHTNRLNV